MICFTHYRGFYTLRKWLHYFSAFVFKKAPIGGRTYSLLNILSSRKAFLWSLSFVCCTCLLLFGLQEAGAQIVEGEIKPLRVGDYVPDYFWEEEILVYNKGDTSSTTLDVYRNKPLILDFWATWCGYCVQGFPALVDIKGHYGNELNILLVNSEPTNDTFEKVDNMPSDILRKNNLPTILKDKYLYRLFPHGPIPHYIWINKRGRVAAITFREFVNEGQVIGFIKRN